MAQTVTAGGRRTAYDVSGDGTPLVLIHGAESDRRQFADFIPVLRKGIRAISYDQRDTGAAAPAGYGMADLADDLADLLDTLDLPAAHLLGTSFGGAVAQHFALRSPDRVLSLTLVATMAAYPVLAGFAARAKGMTADEHAATMLAASVSDAARAADPGLPERVAKALVPREPEQRARRRTALLGHDVETRLPEIKAPTLVIHGTDDPIVPFDSAVRLASLIPQAQLVPLDGGRHGLGFEFRDRLAATVSDFVLDHPAG
ncbi:alpha/beta fold hydrolase [Amycolatopsis jejuensis]|uniref:alpha/beta fold hydrolase n=1 Tax=Amycolatopsis jejuensis TaxID=330084 RepID=UPI000A91543F|nr:alpha/beta hydrolase [Amycolatopsis jejuensis]